MVAQVPVLDHALVKLVLLDVLDAVDHVPDHVRVRLALLIVQVVVDHAQVVKVVQHLVWIIVLQVVRVSARVVRTTALEDAVQVVPVAIQLVRMIATDVVAHVTILVAKLVSLNVQLLVTRHV